MDLRWRTHSSVLNQEHQQAIEDGFPDEKISGEDFTIVVLIEGTYLYYNSRKDSPDEQALAESFMEVMQDRGDFMPWSCHVVAHPIGLIGPAESASTWMDIGEPNSSPPEGER